jgi:gluconate 2-dehydrogenase gamma chain
MNRREALQRTAMVLGYAVSAPLAAAVLNGCKAKPELTFAPKFLNEAQARLVSVLAETILPRTDTPGAIDAGVPGFIDDILSAVYSPEQQKSFTAGLAEIGKEFDFDNTTPEEQLAFVNKKNNDILGGGSKAASEGWWAKGGSKEKPFFLTFKELTLLGFFTSEVGATKVLQYNQVPGPYKGCVPVQQVGKAWAT